MLMIKTYILKSIMTLNTLITTSHPGKPGNGPTGAVVPAGPALKPRPAAVPPRQPLPAPVIDPTKPILQLGLMQDRTTSSGTTESGDTGRPGSRHGLQEEHLPNGGEGKNKKLLGWEPGRARNAQANV